MCHFIFLDNHTLIDLQWSSILKVFIFNTVSDLDSGHPLTDQYGPALCSVLIWSLIGFRTFRKAGWACFAMWNSLAFLYFFRPARRTGVLFWSLIYVLRQSPLRGTRPGFLPWLSLSQHLTTRLSSNDDDYDGFYDEKYDDWDDDYNEVNCDDDGLAMALISISTSDH